ncbi:MAG: hypothetical protein WDM90_03260 [Ferruginibacter sp.]
MQQKYWVIACIALILVITNCSRKHTPQTANATAKPAVKKTTPKKKIPVPTVIVVNDNAAKKSFDGRLYYDLDGHRYWKNYIDGKYYLFNKSMFSDSAYIPH